MKAARSHCVHRRNREWPAGSVPVSVDLYVIDKHAPRLENGRSSRVTSILRASAQSVVGASPGITIQSNDRASVFLTSKLCSMTDFVIGNLDSEHVTIEVIDRGYPTASDYWDGNWLRTMLTIAVGAWRATYPADLRTDEFERFQYQLRTLDADLTGEAVFTSMDGFLDLRLIGDGLGHIRVEGMAQDSADNPSCLEFALPPIDQTYLPALIDSLTTILEKYPVIGDRPTPVGAPATQRRKSRFRR